MAYKMKNSLSGLCSSPLQNTKKGITESSDEARNKAIDNKTKGSKQNENKGFKLNDPDRGPFQKSDDPKRGRIHLEEINGINNKNTVDQSSSTSLTSNSNYGRPGEGTVINDPKGVLNREVRKREYRKGYRYKSEKDGSMTLKGKRGN